MKALDIINKIFSFYIDGFKNMRVGKTLWIIIAIKLFIFIVILKWLFFPNFLKENFSNDEDRQKYISNQLTKGY
jgi:flagellar basal body-associated protein FliL